MTICRSDRPRHPGRLHPACPPRRSIHPRTGPARCRESLQTGNYSRSAGFSADQIAAFPPTRLRAPTGEGSEQFNTSFERWRSLLYKGCVAAVIKELQELHGSGRYSEKQCYGLQGEINYFAANQQRMNYPLYRSCGLPIGSGVVESACKNVVAKRMKQSGMSWSLDGAKEMLQLRASVMSRRFWDDYESLLPSSPTPESDQTQLEAA